MMPIRKIGFRIAGYLFFCFAWQISLATAIPLVDLQQKLESIRTMQAHFEQQVYADSKLVSHAYGDMALARPGRFRWETKQPMAQLVLADGKKLWVYDPDLEQVTVRKEAQHMGASAGLFLSDNQANLSKWFHVKATYHDASSDFELHSKSSQSDFKRMTLHFDQGVLQRMIFWDALNQRTVIHFKKVKTNLALSPQLFQFKPPKGVDVVDEGETGD